MALEQMRRIDQGEFFLIAGPCVAESEELCLRVAESVAKLAQKHNLPFIFKTSFIKANRLSGDSYTGPGIDRGLEILAKVKSTFQLPVLTDVHETIEIDAAAQVADVLQIPAFLCRQTELVVRAAATGRWVNIKKGQFLAPEDMEQIAKKAGTRKVMLTERGASFGYRNLIVDYRGLLIMKKTGLPVVFDATHSQQLPGGGGKESSGQPEFVIPLARAAAAVGIDGLFVETHTNPSEARSDRATQLPLESMPKLIEQVLAIREALK
jgi:2-dehydro-3-deoxyphosphooctonate aldolase (KDO 8-P synthase)